MHVSIAILSGLMPSLVVSAALNNTQMSCLTPPPSQLQADMHIQFAAIEASASLAGLVQKRASINVPTYVHVVSAQASANYGYLSRDTIYQQIQVLNQGFSGTSFQFTLKDIDWTVNQNWAYNYDVEGMKNQLHKGNYKSLNLYYITDIGYGRTGYCLYPIDAPPGSYNFYQDGCIMSAWTTPGGRSPQGVTRYSTGKITTHEVGHWLNLIHTFGYYNSGGCSNGGDLVDDTPAEDTPAYGCQEGRDTCSSPGLDPIHNYMDYSDE
ncbi:hypothetical protein PWT90_10197 [Aphanocladium album]|nr:hypothetical protein PWT90_10197 [Aphanocladium album]